VSQTIVRLQARRDKRVRDGHPWIYSNELVMTDASVKSAEPGEIAEFRTHDSQFIGRGSFNPKTLIAGRIFTRRDNDRIDAGFLRARLRDALALRETLVDEPHYRLIHAEADGLPGLIVDRFGPHFSLQRNTAGMDRLGSLVEAALVDLFAPKSIVLRNDSAARAVEGLSREITIVRGVGGEPIEVRENGLNWFADLHGGQKTGWYFDQRDNRALVARYARTADRVLDLYCNAGGFALCAAKAGAKYVIGVDSSEAALELARKAAEHNGLAPRCHFHRADVFEDLGHRIAAGEKYAIVIADPPAFVRSRKDMASGARGYRKLAKLAASVTAPRGMLFIASCSYNMSLPDFTEQVAMGLHEANREARILHTVFAAPDHPVHPHLPESAYLKGLLLRLDNGR
jgi:23S rRNA (cytosine1962-C5)-methyltransferase